MDHYMEIRLLPDPEFSPTILMNALFNKLHRALVQRGNNAIGVSFPGFDENSIGLGNRLRLHGSQKNLVHLMELNWLTGMVDHIQIHHPMPVPQQSTYRVVRRVQSKSNPERLRRRLMKRRGLDESEALKAIPNHVSKHLELPFITLKSVSTGQNFRLFVEHGKELHEATHGSFSHYGLSPIATVPWF